MALIIKDLPQSDDLDREAMRSIVGGGRTGARPAQIDQAEADSNRIVASYRTKYQFSLNGSSSEALSSPGHCSNS